MSIKERTADTILEKPVELSLGGRTFRVAPPCCATLIEVSRLIPEVPYVDVMGNQVNEGLAMAADSDALFRQVAVMILGVRKNARRSVWPFRDRYTRLAEWMKTHCTPKEMNEARTKLLGTLEVSDFFEFTAFLQEISLIQTTRREAVKMTRYGR